MTAAKLSKEQYRKYYQDLCNYARRNGLSSCDAEDIAQDAIILVLSKLDKLTALDSLGPWLRKAVFYLARRNARGRMRRQRRHQESMEGVRTAFDPAGDYEGRQDLRRGLATLPSLQFNVVRLHVLEGMSMREVAGVLHIPEDTASSSFRLVRQKALAGRLGILAAALAAIFSPRAALARLRDAAASALQWTMAALAATVWQKKLSWWIQRVVVLACGGLILHGLVALLPGIGSLLQPAEVANPVGIASGRRFSALYQVEDRPEQVPQVTPITIPDRRTHPATLSVQTIPARKPARKAPASEGPELALLGRLQAAVANADYPSGHRLYIEYKRLYQKSRHRGVAEKARIDLFCMTDPQQARAHAQLHAEALRIASQEQAVSHPCGT